MRFRLSAALLAAVLALGLSPSWAEPPTGVSYTQTVVTTLKQLASATVNAGGASGTPGACTMTGTTGTGTKFQVTGTVTGGGAISGALVVTVPGSYTVDPTSLAAEPVTGCGLVGATLALTMAALDTTIIAAKSGRRALCMMNTGTSRITLALDGAATIDSGWAIQGAVVSGDQGGAYCWDAGVVPTNAVHGIAAARTTIVVWEQ